MEQTILSAFFYKLKNVHLSPGTQDAMKVSLAAHVMSHTVVSSLNAHVSQDKEQCPVFILL
jgi:hypothetical protein